MKQDLVAGVDLGTTKVSKNSYICSSSSHIQKDGPTLFTFGQDGVGGGQALQDQVRNFNTGGSERFDYILQRSYRAGNNISLYLQPGSRHPYRIKNPSLSIDYISPGNSMYNLLIVRKIYFGAYGDSPPPVLLGDFISRW
ncbi:hypothetical protein HKBW3S33_01726 [Candidatus Hakubella thermalkaliphila]|uniref:Uncharacterized protein n=1 Tax=Candidatus Hakubella thermalkaliphila TaxID=2754717 RepID=A0A6V8PBL5_9ACTN|nr:hypothetical protein [Candidatus Hakubella thermalkaliphila]GFP28311.1 hypothetical protein HKBW3S33_01726 [Candidatus Hakubella thermalkaliphila]